MDKRTLFYWAKLYADQLNPGQPFGELKKTITINILDFIYVELDAYHTIFHLREDAKPEYKLTDILEIHFIELPKFRKSQLDMNNPLEIWLSLLEPASEEVLEMIKDQNRSISKAERVLDWLGTNQETIRLYELREKSIHDEITRLLGAREEGKQEGIKEGIKENQIQVIKNMLHLGVDIDIICSATEVSRKEIEKIRQLMN
jgi:predicted transposase/invertase (TIGR01784 family)